MEADWTIRAPQAIIERSYTSAIADLSMPIEGEYISCFCLREAPTSSRCLT